MGDNEGEDGFKKVYVAHIKSIVFDRDMIEAKKNDFARFIDKVTDVFEYMVEHFDESKRFYTQNFRTTAYTTANGNLTECRNMIRLKNKDPCVLERVAYLCLVLERFLFLLDSNACDFSS
jgi:hypothetical protein